MSGKRDKRRKKSRVLTDAMRPHGGHSSTIAIELDRPLAERFSYAIHHGQINGEHLKEFGIKPTTAVQIANSGKVTRSDLVDKVQSIVDTHHIELPVKNVEMS